MWKIKLQSHNANWKTRYQKEIALLQSFLSTEIVSTHQIGSTVIRNIKAKPVIDILLEANSIQRLDAYNKKLIAIGYEVIGEFGVTGRRFYQKGGDNRTHHVPTYQRGNPEIERHIRFRDYITNNRHKALEYEALKIKLCQLFAQDPQSYSEGKSEFTKSIHKLLNTSD